MAARKLHHLIYVTIANCSLFLIVCAAALGTNKWFSVSSNGDVKEIGGVRAHYGLFNGGKTKIAISQIEKSYDLKIVCNGFKGCMFSCGKTDQQRKQDLQNLLDGLDELDYILCSDIVPVSNDPLTNSSKSRSANSREGRRSNSTTINADETESNDDDGNGDGPFINFGLYIATIAFLVLGMIFSIISGILALYNTYRTPIQPLLSANWLFFWNGVSASLIFLAMVMWLIEFMTGLRKNAAISDTLSGTHDSSGRGSLDVSFWILILPVVFALFNVAILMYRRWKIVKMEEKNVRVMKNVQENGETILF